MAASSGITRRVAVLPEEIANKIAAGEVIQRPASVVKELLENSLDAGARSVHVLVREGGSSLMRIADDGHGMDEADALLAFQRHATSKISTIDDLERISTFGFRGEALASIAAVSRVTMTTRRAADEAAVVIGIEGGGPPRISRQAREPGTTLAVQNLFYNVPARRKFLKTRATEFRHIYETVQRFAISHPEIGIEFVNENERLLHLRPSASGERLLDLFGERQCGNLIPVEEGSTLGDVWGFVGKPMFGQKSRAHQWVFLNRRYITNRNINHAVTSAYEHYLAKGSYPFFILFLDIDPQRVDVNVHPAKLEAKFEDEADLYRLVNMVIRRALSGGGHIPGLSLEGSQAEDGAVHLRFTARQHERGTSRLPGAGEPTPDIDPQTGEIIRLRRADGSDITERLLAPTSGQQEEKTRAEGPGRPEPEKGGSGDDEVWQLERKYILSRTSSGLMIVDQHVAHERILYEQALERMQTGMPGSQQLLFPVTLELNPAAYSLVTELLAHLREIGFDIQLFGKHTVIIDGIPTDVKHADVEGLVQEILAQYGEHRKESPLEVRENLAKSFACKSAVKAGDRLSEPEMRELLERLFETSMPYVCPHGRPVVLRISTGELDRRFGRT